MLSANTMTVILDTNIILAALLSKKGASHQIMRLAIEERLHIAVTTPILLEYESVLKRPELLRKTGKTFSELEDVLDLIALIADKYSIFYRMRPNLFDENDNLFVEAALVGNADYIITSNIKDFKRSELIHYPFRVVTPAEFYTFWRKNYE